MSWTTPDDVTDAWIGDDAPTDDAQIQTWIDKAERMVRFQVPDIQARIDAEAEEAPPVTDLLEAAIDVVVAMVSRVFRNPEGTRSRNTTSGPFTDTVTFGGDQPGGLWITAEELAQLSGSTPAGGAYAVSMIPVTSRFSPDYEAPTEGWFGWW